MTTRRELFGGAAAVLLASKIASAKKMPVPPGPMKAGSHEPVALPFDPSKLHGLSAAMLISHHDNNYVGAVKNLNKVELEIEKTTKDTPGFEVFGLRERELTYTNSKILHEEYFGNLGGDGKLGGAIERRLTSQFGSTARWEELFRSSAMSLGGGSGWVILDANLATSDLRIYATSGHSQSPAAGVPLLVLDMYEHSYAMDFGAAHGKYIDAFFQNVRWDEVDRRLARADRAMAALKA